MQINSKTILVSILLLISLAISAFGATDTAVEQGFGFLHVATNTVTIADSATRCPRLPAGTKNIYVTAWGGDILIGNNTDLASGTAYKAAGIIASGTTVKLDGIFTQEPAIWFVRNSGTTATLIIAAWGTQ